MYICCKLRGLSRLNMCKFFVWLYYRDGFEYLVIWCNGFYLVIDKIVMKIVLKCIELVDFWYINKCRLLSNESNWLLRIGKYDFLFV